MSAPLSQSQLDQIIGEARKVFVDQKQPIAMAMGKKLIINAAASGAFVDRRHNPHIPYRTEEVVKQVSAAYNAGASMWHFHPRDPETGLIFIPMEKRIRIHQEWCEAVLKEVPDIITNVGAVYVTPPILEGRLVNEKSILAETKAAPLIEPLSKLAPNNRYIEVAVSQACTLALGDGTNMLGFNNRAGIVSEVEYLQSKGIVVEISPFHQLEFLNVKEWVLDTGIAKPPVILDTLLGVHNTPHSLQGMEAFEFLFTYLRMMPEGVLWQALFGSRYWMPLTVMAIILGADMVRVGMEDANYMYPHRSDYLSDNGRAVEAVAGIARYLGREVATPAEAREILGLPQVG